MMKALPFLALLTLLFLSAVSPTFAQTVEKKVLIEEFTGAWCGWCPDGMEIVKNLKTQYGDRVIPVMIHNRDAMSFTDGDCITQGMGVAGYPSGAIDRTGTPPARDRGEWAGLTANQLRKAPVVGVAFKQLYDERTRELQVEVTATFLQSVTGDLRFNAYLTEDNVTGSGGGYDQRNYTNNQTRSMWYGKGDPMRNFVHEHVLRAVLGGVDGISRVIPNSVKAGEVFTYTFKTTLNGNWNQDELDVIAYVYRASGPLEVLNADAADFSPVPPCDSEYSYFSGLVTYGDSIPCINCGVTALSANNERTEFIIIDTVRTDENGMYVVRVPMSTDLLMIRTGAHNSDGMGRFIPTYYGRRNVYSFGRRIDDRPCGDTVSGFDIDMRPAPAREGTGRLTGKVTRAGGKNAEVIVANLSLVLIKGGQPVEQATTDENGDISFLNLEPGTYQVWVDRPGMSNSKVPEVDVEAEGNGSENLKFTDSGSLLEVIKPTARNLISTQEANWTVYPNPFAGQTTIQFTRTGSEAVSFRILDMTGRLVEQISAQQVGSSNRITWMAPNAGLYIIEQNIDGKVSYQRVIAQP